MNHLSFAPSVMSAERSRATPAVRSRGTQSHDDIIEAVERLSAILKEENAALREMDFGRAGALLTAKYAAADVLEACVRAATLDVLSAEARDQLWDLADENRELQARSSRIQKRVHSLVTRLAYRRNAAIPA